MFMVYVYTRNDGQFWPILINNLIIGASIKNITRNMEDKVIKLYDHKIFFFVLAGNKNTATHTTTKPIIMLNENSNIDDAHSEASVIPCTTELTSIPPSEYELSIPYHTLQSDAGENVSLILKQSH